MKHCMVDLETWGLTPGSDLRSIGAVVFDPLSGQFGAEFYANVDGGDLYGLTRDPGTVQWWSEQCADAQGVLLINQEPICIGLHLFREWWQDQTDNSPDGMTFWAHGPHFDEVLLSAAFRATNIAVPWNHRAPRDCRTIWEAAGGIDIPFEGVEHNALNDARHQARCVIEAYRRLWYAAGNFGSLNTGASA